VHERFRDFKCLKCDFSVRKIISGRMFEPQEVETLIRDRQVGPLQGFRSKLGRPFAAVMKMNDQFEARFDFGEEGKEGEGGEAPDFTGKEPVGTCPKCKARVFESGTNYVCEKSVGAGKTCDFRSGSIILQQPIDRTQFARLLTDGRTEVLKGFVSKKTGRKFDAFMVLKDGKVGFEFPPREKKAAGAKKGRASATTEPAAKVDFTGLKSLGKCPKCGSPVFEGPEAYLCERSQADTKKCTFKCGKTILEQPVSVEQLSKLLNEGRTDLLSQFVSRAGKSFAAHLILGEKGKVEFDFPPRD
jgi:hypothetical protein